MTKPNTFKSVFEQLFCICIYITEYTKSAYKYMGIYETVNTY